MSARRDSLEAAFRAAPAEQVGAMLDAAGQPGSPERVAALDALIRATRPRPA